MYLGETNWDAVGATAEALGAIGVIATLIYLIRKIVWLAKRPGFIDYWREHRDVYAETFANYVNQALMETKTRL